MKPIWKSKKLARSIKRHLFIVCVASTLLYGCENWPLSQATSRILNRFWYSRIRSVLGITWGRVRAERITNERCARMLGVPDWIILAGRRHARWLGHVARMAPGRLARQTLFGYVKGRTQQKTGLRMNLVAKANTILEGLPNSDTRIWAHKAQKKTGKKRQAALPERMREQHS